MIAKAMKRKMEKERDVNARQPRKAMTLEKTRNCLSSHPVDPDGRRICSEEGSYRVQSYNKVLVSQKKVTVNQKQNTKMIVESTASSVSGCNRHVSSDAQRDDDSDSSLDEFFFGTKHHNHRLPYSNKEDEIILAYVLKKENINRVMSLSLWRELEVVKGEPKRSYQSLKNRFLRNIKPVLLTKFHHMLSPTDVEKVTRKYPELLSKHSSRIALPQKCRPICFDLDEVNSSSDSDPVLVIDEDRDTNMTKPSRPKKLQTQMKHVSVLVRPGTRSVVTSTEDLEESCKETEVAVASQKIHLWPRKATAASGETLHFAGSVNFMSRNVNVMVTAKLEDDSGGALMYKDKTRVNVTCTLSLAKKRGADAEGGTEMIATSRKRRKKALAVKYTFKRLKCLSPKEKTELNSLVEKLAKVDKERVKSQSEERCSLEKSDKMKTKAAEVSVHRMTLRRT